jgi:hypothetical protein
MNVMRLKADIAAGRTGDKSAGFDPAVAALGTDEEAAGTPISSDVAERVRSAERQAGLEPLARRNGPAGRPWIAVGAIGLSAVLVTLIWWLGEGMGYP